MRSINKVHEVYEAIVKLLRLRGVPFTIHEHPPSYTVADARERLPFPAGRLLKTIAFRAKAGVYILAAVRGPDRIDYRKLATASGTKRASRPFLPKLLEPIQSAPGQSGYND